MSRYGEVVYAIITERNYEHKEAYQIMNSKLQGKCIVFIWPEFKAMDSGLLVLLDKILYMTSIFLLSVHFHKEGL